MTSPTLPTRLGISWPPALPAAVRGFSARNQRLLTALLTAASRLYGPSTLGSQEGWEVTGGQDATQTVTRVGAPGGAGPGSLRLGEEEGPRQTQPLGQVGGASSSW